MEMAELALARIAASTREEWQGTHMARLPQVHWKPWFPRLSRFERALEWNPDTHLFADSSTGHRTWVPMVEEIRRAVFRLTKNA